MENHQTLGSRFESGILKGSPTPKNCVSFEGFYSFCAVLPFLFEAPWPGGGVLKPKFVDSWAENSPGIICDPPCPFEPSKPPIIQVTPKVTQKDVLSSHKSDSK